MSTPSKRKEKTPHASVSKAAKKIKKEMDEQRETVRQREKNRNQNAGQKKGPGNRFVNPDGSPKKRPATPEDRHFKDVPICGAKRKAKYADDPANPGVCTLTAGWGTDHVGFGHCKWHFGSSTNGKIAAAREELAVELINRELRILDTYGEDIDIDPHQALAAEVRRTSGHVAWLQQKIKDMEEDELFQLTPGGKVASALLKTYQEERDRLVSVCKAAITAGVAERQITLAEEQGKLLAMVIRDILYDPELELTPAQKYKTGGIVRKHLMALDDGRNIIDVAEVPSAAETG
jgi:hypothetical protein